MVKYRSRVLPVTVSTVTVCPFKKLALTTLLKVKETPDDRVVPNRSIAGNRKHVTLDLNVDNVQGYSSVTYTPEHSVLMSDLESVNSRGRNNQHWEHRNTKILRRRE